MEIIKNVHEDGITEVVVALSEIEWHGMIEVAFEKLKKSLKVKGFRDGKVPDTIAKKQLGDRKILSTALQNNLEDIFNKSAAEFSSEKIIHVNYEIKEMSENVLKLKFDFLIMPEVNLGKYRDLTVEVKKPEINEKEIDAQIAKLQDTQAMMSASNESAKNGDVVDIDYVGYIDNIPFQGGSANHHQLTLGSNHFIPGFENQLIGTNAGDDKDVIVTFPEKYHAAELAGKEAKFVVHVHEVMKKTLPEINDELAIDAGIPGVATLDGLRNYYRDEMKKHQEEHFRHEAAHKLFDMLADDSNANITPAIMEHYLKMFKDEDGKKHENSFAKYLEANNLTEDKYNEITAEKIKVDYKKMAVYSALIKAENLNVTESDIDEEYQKVANTYGVDVETVKKALAQNPDNMHNIIQERKVDTFLLQVNKIA